MTQSYLQRKLENVFYKYGLFASRHPVSMILFSAIMVFSCCYPLLNLPLPGSEPVAFFSPVEDESLSKYPVSSQKLNLVKSALIPKWFSSQHQAAYIQQFLFKTSIHRRNHHNSYALMKAFLATVFQAVKEIKLFNNRTTSLSQSCFHIKKTVIEHRQSLKKMFPENGCLMVTPAFFWDNNKDLLLFDNNILQTVNQFEGKPIETTQSIKEILFGISSKHTGLNSSNLKNKKYFMSYAVTLVLEKYDSRFLKEIHQRLLKVFSTLESIKSIQCHNEANEIFPNCKNQSHGITHVHFKPQIQYKDLVPLVSTYFILGCYIYFSVRKINFVKSKIGMAFCAVVSVMASLMMAVGLCSLTGLTPAQNRGEMFPYLVCIIGLENVLVITKSVVATPIHMDVEKRIAHGLKREGCSITRNLLLEFILISLGYFTLIPEIQEFCAFALVGILSDFFMHMMFFVTVLSIDIRRLDTTENVYAFAENEMEIDKSKLYAQLSTSREDQSKKSKTSKIQTDEDTYHSLEGGGRQTTMLKIPKRLKVVFFFADTRMIQRGLMVSMVIWVACLVYSYPDQEENWETSAHHHSQKLPLHEVVFDPKLYSGDIQWSYEDIYSFQQLGFRHWPTLFAYYNITLAAKFLSILPVFLIPVAIKQISIDNFQQPLLVNSSLKSSIEGQELETDHRLPSDSYTGRYQMTGLDYYLTLLLGAVSGMFMVFLLNIMYRCVCSRDYANWHLHRHKKQVPDSGTHMSSVGESLPLILTGHTQLIEFVNANEFNVISTDIAGTLKIWDYHSGECSGTIDRSSADEELRNEFGKALGSSMFVVLNFSLCNPAIALTEKSCPSAVWSLTCYRRLLILGCDTGRIEIWDSISLNLRCFQECGRSGVVGLAVEDYRLVAARIGGTLDFYQIEATTLNPTALQHRGSFRKHHNLECDVLSLQLVYSIKSAHQQTISAFTVSIGRILTGSCDHTLKLFNMQDARCQFTLLGHNGAVTCAAMDKGPPTGAVSGSADGSVKLWDLLTGICVHTLDEHTDSLTAVQCSSSHVVSFGQDGKFCIWARRTGFLLQVVKLESALHTPVKMLGKSLCITGGNGDIFLWDVRKGELLRRMKLLTASVTPTPVGNIVLLSDLSIVCAMGHELYVVKFPSVMEKNE
uniref:Sterol regulatory element-binding protein cleavage-activating protein n=1 Tax=Phallusia mammillata TaxID=59560 RepID=A0A6F9DR13_9ASCI|nr:sterol regulatory element-binding protein cleavage-activating protein-like [Phallusia mammillata]